MALTQISTAGVKDDAVTSGKIPANAVGSSELADNAVDTNAIQDDAVTADKIANNAVTVNELGSGAVTNAKLASSAVGAGNLQSNAVETTKIQDQAVTLAKLEHGTSSNNGKFLRANNGADPTFETVNTDLVSDTSPQLGGELDTNGSDIRFADTDEAIFGNGADLKIYHEGGSGDNIIKNNVASKHLKIQHNDGSAAATFYNNTSVVLYNAGSSKFETTSNGIKVIGESDATAGVIQLTNSSGKKSAIGTHFASNAYDSRVEIGISDGSTSGGTNRVASFSYAGLSFGTDTANANRLDDYEEGTYTPTFVSTGATFAYNHQYGYYQKVGNTVHVSFYITLGNGSPLSGTTTNNLEIYVPFAATSATRYEAACCFSMIYKFNLNASSGQDIPLTGRLYSGRQGIELLAQFDDTSGYAYPAVKADQGGCGLAGSITYRV